MAGIKFDWALRTKDKLRTRDGGGGSGSIPGIFRFRGTFDISNPLVADYPKNTAGAAVNATQVGDGSGMPGPFVQNGDGWRVIGGGGRVGPTGKQTTDSNMIVAIVDNATNSDADWVIFETDENDVISVTYASATALMIGGELIPGQPYRITDRFNMILIAIAVDKFSMDGNFLVPAFGYFNFTPEVVFCVYDIFNDTVLYYVDQRSNKYYGSAVWSLFVTARLFGHRFGESTKEKNEYSDGSNLINFTGIVNNCVLRGSFTPSGTGLILYLHQEAGTSFGGGGVNTFDGIIRGCYIGTGSTISILGPCSPVIVGLNLQSNSSYNINTDNNYTQFYYTGLTNSVWTCTANNQSGFHIEINNLGGAFTTDYGTTSGVKITGGSISSTGSCYLSDTTYNNCSMTLVGASNDFCSFDHSYLSMTGGGLTNCQMDYYQAGQPMIGYTTSNKRYSKGFSDFVETFDITGLTTLDMSTRRRVGIAKLTSINPTETLNSIIAPTNHSVTYEPVAFFAVDFVPTSVTVAVANDIVLENIVTLTIDGTEHEELTLKVADTGVGFNQQVIGSQYA